MQVDLSKIRTILQQHGIELVGRDQLQVLVQQSKDFQFLSALKGEGIDKVLHWLPQSKAQLRQDLLALFYTGFRTDGYFVEFGGTDGVHWSNTHLLEKEFGWSGIVGEPARQYHHALKSNRSCHIETDCVWSQTGLSLKFNETKIGYYSTIEQFSSHDNHHAHRTNGTRYRVRTISLMDLLEKYDAPKQIDFLSIDTEGSELEILSAFDFEQYSISIIACEHNYTDKREKIHGLLSKHGYTRIMTEVSQFDDWYILRS